MFRVVLLHMKWKANLEIALIYVWYSNILKVYATILKINIFLKSCSYSKNEHIFDVVSIYWNKVLFIWKELNV